MKGTEAALESRYTVPVKNVSIAVPCKKRSHLPGISSVNQIVGTYGEGGNGSRGIKQETDFVTRWNTR